MTDTEQDPAAALDSIRRAKAEVADRFTRGGWVYDMIYAALAASIVAAFGFLPMPYNIVAEGASLLCLLVLARWWKNRTGVWISGVWPARARWVAIGLGLAVGALMLANVIWKQMHGALWLPVMTTGLAAVLAFAGSRLWTTIYRRESGLK